MKTAKQQDGINASGGRRESAPVLFVGKAVQPQQALNQQPAFLIRHLQAPAPEAPPVPQVGAQPVVMQRVEVAIPLNE